MHRKIAFHILLKKVCHLHMKGCRMKSSCSDFFRIIHDIINNICVEDAGAGFRIQFQNFCNAVMVKGRINHAIFHLHLFCQLEYLFFQVFIPENTGFQLDIDRHSRWL